MRLTINNGTQSSDAQQNEGLKPQSRASKTIAKILAFTVGALAASPMALAKANLSQKESESATSFIEDVQVEGKHRVAIFVGGFQTKEENFKTVMAELEPHFDEMIYMSVGQSMFRPDHLADYAKIESRFDEVMENDDAEVFAVGYSLGGKMVAKLALERENLAGLLLLDPVDGALFSLNPKKTPTFLLEGDEINVPTAIIWSEHGEKPKFGPVACVPEEFGSKHFMKHINPDSLKFKDEVEGAGHLNFIDPPWARTMKMSCDNSTADYEFAREFIAQAMVRFVIRPAND